MPRKTTLIEIIGEIEVENAGTLDGIAPHLSGRADVDSFNACLEQGELEEAERILSEGDFIRFLPLPDEFYDASAELYLELGDRYKQKGELEKAVIAYVNSAKLTHIDYFNSARYTWGMGSPKYCLTGLDFAQPVLGRLKEILDKPTKFDPKNKAFYYALGEFSLLKGDLKNTETNFKKAARLDPKDGSAYSILGIMYQAQGRYRKARAAFKRASRLGNEDAKAVLEYDPSLSITRCYGRLFLTAAAIILSAGAAFGVWTYNSYAKQQEKRQELLREIHEEAKKRTEIIKSINETFSE